MNRGVLVLALMMLSFLSLLGGALLTSATLDVAIGDNYRTEVQLQNLAESGLEEAREHLRLSPETPSAITPIIVGSDLGRYSVFLLSDANHVLTLRSTAEARNAHKTIEERLVRAGFPELPAELTLADDPQLDPRLRTAAGIERLLKDIASNATETYPLAALGNVGNSDNYRVTVVNGDCDFGPGTGYGILVVRGKLTLKGNFRWNGLILVVGEGRFTALNDARGQILGAVFVARTQDASPAVVDLNRENVAIELDRIQTGLSRYAFPYKVIAVREY